MNTEQHLLDAKELLKTTAQALQRDHDSLTKVDQSLNTLGETTVALSKVVISSKHNLDQQNSTLNELKIKQEGLVQNAKDIKNVLEDIQNIEAQSAQSQEALQTELLQLVTNQDKTTEELKQEIMVVYQKYANGVIALSTKLDDIKSLVEAGKYEELLQSVEHKMQETKNDIDTLRATHATTSKTLEEQFDMLGNRVQQLTSELQSATSETKATEQRIGTLVTRLGVIETRLETLGI